ncbi:MAG TPA: flavin reductase family protein [Candidatus Nanoarchaeia archaeon]|nr:flavin reductase family protein [Candidatus Nanoarchaeia archaeon]
MLIFNPRQTVLITCRGKFEIVGKSEEKDDIVPLHWHSPVSDHPPMYSIFLNKNLMAVQIIRNSGCFVINFIPFSLIDTVKTAMKTSGEYLDKCKTIGINEESCEKLVDCFRLKEALGWLECEVVEEKEYGDHIMFIGKVLFSQLDHDEKRLFHVKGDEFTTTKS